MNRGKALKLCDLEFENILGKLKRADRNFRELEEKEKLDLFSNLAERLEKLK